MSNPAGNHVLEEYRRQLRIFMKRCNRVHGELAEKARRSKGEKPYSGITSWTKEDQRWRSNKLSELRSLEKALPFSRAEREKRIQEIKDEMLQEISRREGSKPSN